MKTLFPLAILLMTCACSSTQQAAVVGDDGSIMTGTYTHSFPGDGAATISYGTVVCNGTGDTLSMAITCNDGLKGALEISENGSGKNSSLGAGRFILNNGYKGDFIIGDEAKNFSPKPATH